MRWFRLTDFELFAEFERTKGRGKGGWIRIQRPRDHIRLVLPLPDDLI